jgi:proteasome lid subunit RPN8/RPN11
MIMPDNVRNDVVDHLRSCLPYEGVGLLATRAMERRLEAHCYYPGRNVDASPCRYTMDPADVQAALRDMARRKMRLLAIVHSHPDTPPVPSGSDLAEAEVPGVLSLIVRLSPQVELRAWQIVFSGSGSAVLSKEVQIVDSGDRSWSKAALRFTSR